MPYRKAAAADGTHFINLFIYLRTLPRTLLTGGTSSFYN